MDSFFCAAEADRSYLGATVQLPSCLRSDRRYEVALLYCSFLPSWKEYSDFWVITTGSTNITEKVFFPHLKRLSTEGVLEDLIRTLVSKYGNKMQTARMKIAKDGEMYQLKVRKNCKVHFSTSLAKFLGIGLEVSAGEATASYDLKPEEITPNLRDDIVSVACDEINANYVNPTNSTGRVLSVIDASEYHANNVIKHTPMPITYHPIYEEVRHQKLNIKLRDRNGHIILVNNPQFYVLLHIRVVYDGTAYFN